MVREKKGRSTNGEPEFAKGTVFQQARIQEVLGAAFDEDYLEDG